MCKNITIGNEVAIVTRYLYCGIRIFQVQVSCCLLSFPEQEKRIAQLKVLGVFTSCSKLFENLLEISGKGAQKLLQKPKKVAFD